MNDLLHAALEYKRMGISVVGITADKRSYPRQWGKYQHELISDKTLIKVFANPIVCGIGIICGSISQNLEVMDFDCKYDLSNSLFGDYLRLLNETDAKLSDRLVMASTKNDGYHFIYRCHEIGSNTTLAQRPCTEAEKMKNPDDKIKVLIETRGTGGYGIVFPTSGYRFIQHDLSNISLIGADQRRLLFSIARTFNQCHEPESLKIRPECYISDPQSPFHDYDNRGDIIELLKRHGWKVIRTSLTKTHFRRPGDTDHDTSGDFNHKLRLFGVFSTSTEFKARKGYKPYQVYAILECGRDFKLAAKKLLGEGYGIPYKDRF